MAQNKLLGVAEVAELLGVSKATVSKLMKEKRMPHMKIGKLVRFDADAVMEWATKFTRA